VSANVTVRNVTEQNLNITKPGSTKSMNYTTCFLRREGFYLSEYVFETGENCLPPPLTVEKVFENWFLLQMPMQRL
jgi:hypothetical protein